MFTLRAASPPSIIVSQTPQRRMHLKHQLGALVRVTMRLTFPGREHSGRDITTQLVGD